jgi:hypothetical protein
MGITSAGLQTRNAGWESNARQNGCAELAENDGSLSRITSTAASAETDPKPKLKFTA